MAIYQIMHWFQWGCMLLGFLFSIPTIGNKKIPVYMKGFYVYPLVAACLSSLPLINYCWPGSVPDKLYFTINICSLFFHLFFLSLFFFRIPLLKTARPLMIKLLILFCIVLVIFAARNIYNPVGRNSFSIANTCLASLCIIYYFELFRQTQILNLFEEPSFWLVTGIFLTMTVIVPLDFLESVESPLLRDEILKGIHSIGSFVYGIMHLFFIKSYICSVKTAS